MSSPLDSILNTAASGMSAQSIRLSAIASNMANADTVGSTPETTYHEKLPIFEQVTQNIPGLNPSDQPIGGVRVTRIAESQAPLIKRFDPQNPLANEEGFVYSTNVNSIEQMTNMIDASRSYQADIQMVTTVKDLLSQSLDVLKT